jgi:hypothetical protein
MSGRWYIATGNSDPGGVLFSQDGVYWETANTSIADVFGETVSVQFRDPTHGVAIAGGRMASSGTSSLSSWSEDGGNAWKQSTSPGEYRTSIAWIPSEFDFRLFAIAVGPSGSDFTFDGGKRWDKFSNKSFDTVRCTNGTGYGVECWAAGPEGIASFYWDIGIGSP